MLIKINARHDETNRHAQFKNYYMLSPYLTDWVLLSLFNRLGTTFPIDQTGSFFPYLTDWVLLSLLIRLDTFSPI